jgi:hypothetical protein
MDVRCDAIVRANAGCIVRISGELRDDCCVAKAHEIAALGSSVGHARVVAQ